VEINSIRAVLSAAQEYVAGPLGATAKLTSVRGAEEGVTFDYAGVPVQIWLDQRFGRNRPPFWMRVSFGPFQRLYRSEEGYVLAEGGTLPRQGSLLPAASDEQIIEILQGTLAVLQQTKWQRQPRPPVIARPREALQAVQTELAGPLGASAQPGEDEPELIAFEHQGRDVEVQFPQGFTSGMLPAWIRVSLNWRDYLCLTGEGYTFVSQAAAAEAAWEITHCVRGYGDILEVLRGARYALDGDHIRSGVPRRSIPAEVLAAIEEHFAAALAQHTTVTDRTGTDGTALVQIETANTQKYLLRLDPGFLQDGFAGRWASVALQEGDQVRHLCRSEAGFALVTGREGSHTWRLATGGLPGLRQLLHDSAAFLSAPGESPAEAEPPLWTATEGDSGLISLPAVVSRMRADLGRNLAWSQIAGRAERIGPGQRPKDLSGALRMLASVWFTERFPTAKRKTCMAFAAAVSALACRGAAVEGGDRVQVAVVKARAAIARFDARKPTAEEKARAVVDFLAGHLAPRVSRRRR